MPDIESTLRLFLAENILFSNNGYPHPDEASFLESGVVDSLNIMEIVSFVERAFGVSIADRDIVPANFDSVSSIAAYVRRQRTPVA